MTLISGPAIAALSLRTRMWANKGIRRGWFGPSRRHRGVLFVDLQAVQAFFGVTFTQAQLEQALAGLPGRVLNISEGSHHGETQART